MKPLAKLGYLAAACALLVATFSIIGPRAVRAAVATLVQVANTTEQPVPNLDMNTPGEESFQAFLCTNNAGNGVCPTNGPTASYIVPGETADGRRVRRLVITYASAYCGSAITGPQLITNTSGVFGYFVPVIASSTTAIWNGPFFADPGLPLSVYVGANCSAYLTGYYLTQ